MEKMLAAPLLFILFLARHQVAGDRFCGVDLEDAQSTCWQPCSTDNDCCASSHRCYEAGDCGSADKSGTNHYFCGTSWCAAAYECGTPCPEQTECPEGQSCYADIPCDSESGASAPPLPQPPTEAPYQFCGSSLQEAKDNCWQPCPRGQSDCCFGTQCFDTSAESGPACAISDYSGSGHYFCGSTWCEAAYSCNVACPGGQHEECPGGQYCYADIPCSSGGGDGPPDVNPPDVQAPPSIYSMYCGDSLEDAAEQCWQPCRNDDDCCADQTCFAAVTTCPYPDNIGADHFFCGTDFCDAAFTCPLPCPSGFDAQCPDGQRCFANTPCNANIQIRTADTLDYGLPMNALRMMQQFNPESFNEATVNAKSAPSSSSGGNDSISVGLIFGICIASLLALNYVWSRYTVA